VPDEARARTVRLAIAMRAPAAVEVARAGFVWARRVSSSDSSELTDEAGELRVVFAAGALFEDATVVAYALPASAPDGLVSVGRSWCVEPSTLPLRRSARIAITAPAGAPLDRVGLYRLDGGSWQWAGAHRQQTERVVRGESRRLGCFALFRDLALPNIKILPPEPPPTKRRPYSRWAVEAIASDAGSGIDASESYLEIDGRRVPTEWDSEAGRLRWRPLEPPVRGRHDVVGVATDHAGNTVRTTGAFKVGP